MRIKKAYSELMTAKPQYQNIPTTQTIVTYKKKKAIVTSKKKDHGAQVFC